MLKAKVYVDLNGREICLGHLDAEERKVLARIRRRPETHADWCDFDNCRWRVLAEFYGARSVPRKAARQGAVYRVAQDLSARLGLAAGRIEPDNWRGDLENLIQEKYPSRKAFCEATGLSETMLSHVLAGRKDLSLESLTGALEPIGYRLRIVPALGRQSASQASKRTG